MRVTSDYDRRPSYGYIRVSTESQAEDGESLGMQQSRIKSYAESKDWDLCKVFSDEGISGKDLEHRPGAQLAIDAACKSAGVLIVYSLSRLSRSLTDTFSIAEKLQKSGAEIVSLKEQFDTTSATGRMIFGILAVLHQFEREITRERTQDTLRKMRQDGKRVGRYPQYGYYINQDGVMCVNEAERETIVDIVRSTVAGLKPHEIVTLFNSRGKNFRGRQWRRRDIEKILKYEASKS